MLSTRPEVKRTYSRLPKKTEDIIIESAESETNIRIETEIKNDKRVDGAVCNDDRIAESEDKLSSVQPEKMKKITDFFRIKRKSLSEESETPVEKMVKSCSFEPTVSSSPSAVVANKLKQTFLDLGQRNLVSTQCPDCLMHYNKSFADDVALHRKFHSNYLKGYNFNVNIGGTCVEIGPPGESVLKWSKYRFYALKAFDASAFKKLDFFMNFVHVQLGAEPLSSSELCEAGRFDAIFAVDFGSNRIVGFGLFEPCVQIYRSLRGCNQSAIELEGEPFGGSGCFCGVSRIWTDSGHRSRGLASLILDLKCAGKRDLLAFSQPTPAGFAFAKAYQRTFFSGEQCLIYLK